MHCPACHEDNPPGATACDFCRTPLPDPASRFQPTVPVSGVSVGDQSFAVGGLIAGRYLVERELGRGGMGVVYLVRDQKLHGKEVALKLISAELTASHQGQERFVQEVLAARELHHQNIVRVFHLDEVAGQSFFTMEYVPGRSLREVVEERKRQGQPFSLKECEAVLMPVLKALHHAHTQNPPVIHRDIKPDNIIVTGDFPNPQVKVLDFGLAKMLSPSKLTTTAMTMGTAYYMAPEQVQGAKDIDQRADLFSVGVVLYEMLTGRIPSGFFSMPSELDSSLPGSVDEVIKQTLQQIPDKRYSTARELAGSLESLVRDADEEARRKEREAAEAELRKQREAEEAVKRQAEVEARRVAQEEARRKAEEEDRQKVEEAKVKAAEEARQRAENEARIKAEAEAEARRQAEEEAKRKAEEDARVKAEAEARRQAEVEAKRKAADEARRRQLEAERLEEEEFARRKAEAESRRRKMFFAAAGVVLAVLAFFVWQGLDKPADPPQIVNGDTWRDPVTGMEFVWVPKGCYQMGSNVGRNDESPVHEVCIDGFWMGRYEVTQAEWQRVMGNNPSVFKGDHNPVELVSWNDVQEFIIKLNAGGNGRFRLPTEAEWEYAARSGGRNEMYAGGNDPDLVAWHDGNSGGLFSKSQTNPVGTKGPNGLGLYDMSGNVWEWCQDVYDSYSKHSPNNPIISSGGSLRVNRGGSWLNRPGNVRAALRGRNEPGFRGGNLGFRLVRTE